MEFLKSIKWLIFLNKDKTWFSFIGFSFNFDLLFFIDLIVLWRLAFKFFKSSIYTLVFFKKRLGINKNDFKKTAKLKIVFYKTSKLLLELFIFFQKNPFNNNIINECFYIYISMFI